MAWAYSGAISARKETWDLWMVWSCEFKKLRKRADMRKAHPTEWRTTEPAPKKVIWLVGSRVSQPRIKRARK
jgi:hypothetical protein